MILRYLVFGTALVCLCGLTAPAPEVSADPKAPANSGKPGCCQQAPVTGSKTFNATLFCVDYLSYSYGNMNTHPPTPVYVYVGWNYDGTNCQRNTSYKTSDGTLQHMGCPNPDQCFAPAICRPGELKAKGGARSCMLGDALDEPIVPETDVVTNRMEAMNRIFVQFSRPQPNGVPEVVICQLRLLQHKAGSDLDIVAYGVQVTELPSDEYAFTPDSVSKVEPGNPDSGLYDVTLRGITFHVICTKDPT